MRTSKLGFYRLTYDGGISQTKELISPEDSAYYRELTKSKSDLEVLMKSSKNKGKDPVLIAELTKISKTIKTEFPVEFFVVGSPMYDALTTGVIHIPEPAGNAGDYNMRSEKIEKDAAIPQKEIE